MKQELVNLEGLLCEKCAPRLSKVFGMSKTEIQNGGMKELIWKVQLAEITMKEVGIEFNEDMIIEKTTASMTKLFKEKWIDEIQKRHEEELDRIKEENEEDSNKSRDLKNENGDLKLQLRKLAQELEEFRSKEKLQPVKMGDKLEDIVSDALKRAFTNDDIIEESKGKNEVDVKEIVKDGKQTFGKILVECKNTTKWSNSWLDTIQEHGRRENTEFLVIVTKAVPNEKSISPLGLEKDGVLITTPEKSVWAVAFMRMAILRTANAMKEIENERERLSKQSEAKQKFFKLIKSEDFEDVLSTCEDIKRETQKIRDKMSKFNGEIVDSANSIEGWTDLIVRTNSKVSEAFDKLVE